ncbi:MAG: hypothetical protein JJU36_08785, partial [Phycisphaeraceae bacterium]|nr:hypothetical protein [Phycisphaeraceae bacterium]
EVVSSTGLDGSGIYNDPQALLGPPSLYFNHSLNPHVPDIRRTKLIEPAWNVGPDGEKLLTTLAEGTQVTVRMGQPVYSDPLNPFGIDFVVFGNSLFSGTGGFISDATNLNTFMLADPASGVFEKVKVSVSPDNINWYRYDDGPYGDGPFPTNAFAWDRIAAAWTDEPLDPTRPIDPALSLADFGGLSAADALDLYAGSMGGTGFDLAESGFEWIQYIRFEGLSGFANGEIDAVARVRPRIPGDANWDHVVDDADLAIVGMNLGMSGAVWRDGDFTGDGRVGLRDAFMLLEHYGHGVATQSVSAIVPEPAGGVVMMLLGAYGLHRRTPRTGPRSRGAR